MAVRRCQSMLAQQLDATAVMACRLTVSGLPSVAIHPVHPVRAFISFHPAAVARVRSLRIRPRIFIAGLPMERPSPLLALILAEVISGASLWTVVRRRGLPHPPA